jgi:hypothetical protein
MAAFVTLTSATATNGSPIVTSEGVVLTGLIRENDFFVQNGLMVLIESVEHVTGNDWEITLKHPWPGTTTSDDPAEVWQLPDNVRLNQSITELVQLLDASDHILHFSAPPNDTIGVDGQIAFVPSLRSYYEKRDGSWVKLDVISFLAHKNDTDQEDIVIDTWTKLTFGTESFDVGGGYNNADSNVEGLGRGKYVFEARALITDGSGDGLKHEIEIRKNDTPIHRASVRGSSTDEVALFVSGLVSIDSEDDVVNVWIRPHGGSARTVSGAAAETNFSGVQQSQANGPTVSDVLATLGVTGFTISNQPPPPDEVINGQIWVMV